MADTDDQVDANAPPPMPGDPGGEPSSDASGQENRPAGPGRQLLQLVIVPALIVMAAAAIAYPLIQMFSVKGTMESHLAVLERTSGLEQEKWRALHALTAQIAAIDDDDDAQRAAVHARMLDALEKGAPGKEGKVRRGVILLIGSLQQPDGLEAIVGYADSTRVFVRRAVVEAILQWNDRDQAHRMISQLIGLAGDNDVFVKGYAAKALGRFAVADDAPALEALRQVLRSDVQDHREASWDAAIALARMGDAEASEIVAEVLLTREALAQLPADVSGEVPGQMSPGQQDRVILLTLAEAAAMTDRRVRAKIMDLATSDPNRVVRLAADNVVRQWE